MSNQSGHRSLPRFRKGTKLTAEDLNRIVAELTRRIQGGKGISIRSFSGQIIIESRDA